MAEIIDGKLVSSVLRDTLKDKICDFKSKTGKGIGLAVIIVGSDPASQVYVRNKHLACRQVGIDSLQIELPESITEDELIEKIQSLNNDDSINGILVQLPLPRHINEEKITNSISPLKDVDAFHPSNVGKIMIGNHDFLPCTPAGIIALLDYYNIQVEGKRCVVIGRSNIVGKPMAMLLMERHGTVTVCHSRTKNIAEITRDADILVVAIGKANYLTADMVKDGAVVIDVGINRLDNGKLVGDVRFDEVSDVASMITPVPGGVGPMTITMLLYNTLTAANMQNV